MTDQKGSWDDIPSLDGLGVDWDYEPENPLGKRSHVRMGKVQLRPLLGGAEIFVKVVSQDGEQKATMLDITQQGIGVLLDQPLKEKQPVKIGLFLGKQKIISNGLVRNVMASGKQYRIGIEFINIKEEYATYIATLFASTAYEK